MEGVNDGAIEGVSVGEEGATDGRTVGIREGLLVGDVG